MQRVHLIKHAIRLGMRFIPNHTRAYRFFSALSPLLMALPAGCVADALEIAGRPALWLAHSDRCDARVVLYLHGGGYVIGSNQTHLNLAGRLSRATRAQVLMLDYRLAPEHPYPAAIDDAMAAYQYLLDQRVRPEQIILAGDSAGGGLALATSMRIRDEQLPQPAGVVCLSPWLDVTCNLAAQHQTMVCDPLISADRIQLFAQQYAAGHDLCHPGISPFYGELRGLSPVLIQVGGDELLVGECRLFAERAAAEGAAVHLEIWPEMFHVWHFAAAILPEARQALHRIGQFVQQVAPAAQPNPEVVRARRQPVRRSPPCCPAAPCRPAPCRPFVAARHRLPA